jgi:hypothetical protein
MRHGENIRALRLRKYRQKCCVKTRGGERKKSRRERGGFSPALTAFCRVVVGLKPDLQRHERVQLVIARDTVAAVTVVNAAHFTLDVQVRLGYRLEVQLGVTIA